MKLINKNSFCTLFTKVERFMDVTIPPVTVLAYHAVSHDRTIVDIEPSVFEKQLQILKNTCEFITLDQVVNFVNGKESFTKPAVALTFDDGYEDIFYTVMPILAQEQIPAAVFALSDSEHANRAELENNKPLLTMKQLQTLHQMGWTIGCHSATHANFANRSLQIHEEIIESKKQLEQQVGFSIPYFAYPKGIYTPSVIKAVESAEFIAGFAFESGFISHKTSLFTIPRMPVDWTHTEEQFEAFFTNWGILYLQTKQKFERNNFAVL